MGVMSVSYTTINGEIVSENRNGVPSDYIPDALGSTIALLSSQHQITDTWTYWPYGEVRTHTGSSVTPFTFGGTVGYHSDVLGSFTYVRASELRVSLTRWQRVDPLWPSERPFCYAKSTPVTLADPAGLSVGSNWQKCFRQQLKKGWSQQSACVICEALAHAGNVQCGKYPWYPWPPDVTPPPPPPPPSSCCKKMPPSCAQMVNTFSTRMIGGINPSWSNGGWESACEACAVARGGFDLSGQYISDCIRGEIPGFALDAEGGLDAFLQSFCQATGE
jgi:hypothetical protein